MPMPKGTKPKVRNFAEVDRGTLFRGLRVAASDNVIRSDVEGRRTVWKDKDGNVVAKQNIYKKTEQCLLSADLARKVSKVEKEAQDAKQAQAS